MRDFQKYTEEMELFENSETYQKYYRDFIIYLKNKKRPVKSGELERVLGIRGASIRSLVRHARRSAEPIASNGEGYKYAHSYEDLVPTLEHLRERRNSLSFTLNKLEKSFTELLQTDLFKE